MPAADQGKAAKGVSESPDPAAGRAGSGGQLTGNGSDGAAATLLFVLAAIVVIVVCDCHFIDDAFVSRSPAAVKLGRISGHEIFAERIKTKLVRRVRWQ